MQTSGIVLIHGYSGRPEELAPLKRLLGAQFGQDAVRTVNLPGHAEGAVPAFDAMRFGNAVDDAVRSFRKENRIIILLGHSTGGTLALDHLHRTGTVPALLILAGTPAAIDGRDLQRWEQRKGNTADVSLLNVARMVSCVNHVGATPIVTRFPVLLLYGASDQLVPPLHAETWQRDRFPGPVRCVVIPAAGHDLFTGPGSGVSLDCVCRAVTDAGASPASAAQQASVAALKAMDAGVAGFLDARPQSARHILNAPGALRALNQPFGFEPVVKTDPIQLNIEITSRCNLSCGHCARSHLPGRPGKDMPRETFQTVLDLMPNTYKVVLVGLGEPTLHPQLADFVSLAARRGHRAHLVTNALSLDGALSRRLVAAGLCGLTFSLDSVDPDLASRVRPGSDVGRIIGNIRAFMASAGGKIPTAVFTAVSVRTVPHLPALAAAVAALGVNAWVLTDLNFQWNQSERLWHNWTGEHREAIGNAIKVAFSHALPVLSVRGIEELGLAQRYGDFVLTAPGGLPQRSTMHRWCLSPWQTLPVDVDGNATVCDCRPHDTIGNVLEKSFTDIWNAAVMQAHRRRMRADSPPAQCLICPRF